MLNRIKTYAKNSDYKQVATELENFTSDFQNPQITHKDYFKGIIVDYYDFEYIPQEDFEKFITYLYNTGAYYLQELHRLKNYYFLIPIEFKW